MRELPDTEFYSRLCAIHWKAAPIPRKILVVDDNLDTRELTHLHLTTEGFAESLLVTGQEGLCMAVAEQPDVIIRDEI